MSKDQEQPDRLKAVTTENGKRVFNSQGFYLEYLNDFLSVEAIADYYMIEVKHAENLINWGRQIHNQKTNREILGI